MLSKLITNILRLINVLHIKTPDKTTEKLDKNWKKLEEN